MLNNKFSLITPLRQSHYSSTYLALDQSNQNQVIVKELIFGKLKDWKTMELFEREYSVLKQLHHPCIPNIVDYFKLESKHELKLYLVQSYIKGKSLSDYILENERLSEEKAISNLKQILKILVYIHTLNPPLIHRDIKPDNIIISENNKISLVDFGSTRSSFNNDMTIVGTYGYMPLEQFGGDCYPASDIYSLGMTMIFWLSHVHPSKFPKQNGKIDFLSYCSISNDFYHVLTKMIEPDVRDRYQNASVVFTALHNLSALSMACITSHIKTDQKMGNLTI